MFKKVLKRAIIFYLALLARQVIKKARPFTIAITGSVGKTTTKEAVFAVLREALGNKVYKTEKNLNSEFGLPLAILGLKEAPKNLGWFLTLTKAPFLVFTSPLYKARYFVAETAADKPGDISHLLTIIKPSIAIVTSVAPVHLESQQFSSLEAIAQEKFKLVEALPKEGTAILNSDNAFTLEMAKKAKTKVLLYGSSEKAEVNEKELTGINLKILGDTGKYSALAGIAVAKVLGISREKIVSALEQLKPLPGRMNLVRGIKNSLIIDDTYNANPLSMASALAVLKGFAKKGRRVAILGNMNELGQFSKEEHLKVGRIAGESADFLITIGERGRWIGQGALKAGLKKERVLSLQTPEEAILEIPSLIEQGDIILVKASQNLMRLERVVEVLLENPEDAKRVLVKR